jgi:hypothetical protein
MATMDHSVIDLSSSPEPSTSLVRRKIKARPKPRSRISPLPIIELTDSESDDAPTFSPQRKKIQSNAVASTSSHPSETAALQPKIGPSGSFENIPNTPNRTLKTPITRPFPFFEPSDEENEPPEPSSVAIPPIVDTFSPFENVQIEDVQPAEPPPAVEIVDHVPEADPISTYVARVLEIVPDVEPDYLLDLVTQNITTQGDQVVEHVLHGLFENPTYPKVDRKGKRKQADGGTEGDETPLKKTKLDYRNKERLYNGGEHYSDMALVPPCVLTTVVFPDVYLFRSNCKPTFRISLKRTSGCHLQTSTSSMSRRTFSFKIRRDNISSLSSRTEQSDIHTRVEALPSDPVTKAKIVQSLTLNLNRSAHGSWKSSPRMIRLSQRRPTGRSTKIAKTVLSVDAVSPHTPS